MPSRRETGLPAHRRSNFSNARLLLLIVISITSIFMRAQDIPSQIDSLFSKFTADGPGCAVLVVKDGRVVFRKGYGAEDLRTMQKIGPDTNFRLASLSKQFTATAIMLLVKEGKLRYDDRLTEVFPDFPAYGRAITIRELLNHTSGLPDYEDILEKQYSGVPDERIPQIRDAGVLQLLNRQAETMFVPGTRWHYSNSGYAVLAMAVEKKSGMGFGDFLRKQIFEPLGMENTIAYEHGRNEIESRAYGYTQTAGAWHETDQSPTSAVLGDGGIYSSLIDLERWDQALASHALLSAEEITPALTAPCRPRGTQLLKNDGSLAPPYGFGWFLEPLLGHRRHSHYGETIGFRTSIQRFPDDHLTVLVLANRADLDAPRMAENVAELYLKTK